MRTFNLRAVFSRWCVLASAGAVAYMTAVAFAPSSTESAAANGDTRTLHLYHTHTGETIDATFRVDGHYDPTVLAQLNHFLRDWRNNDEHVMDPRLFDAVWEAYRTAGATDRIQIYSAYRSPETNAMLRRRSRAVAEHSQHMLGKAMDTTMPGFPMYRVREAGMKLQHGGVGWYPSANFVHLDVGGVRSWPRMPYYELARLFPDGKTVHISSDGRTLPGYEEARVELAQRGGEVEVPPAQQSQGFFAWLFGGGGGGAAREDEEDRRAPAVVASAAPPQAEVQQPAPRPEAAPQPALAYAAPTAAQPEAQPLDGRVRVDGTQVASLEPADTDKTAADVVMPLPPHRPADLAFVEPDVPLPPVRPVALDRVQTASIRYSDAQSAPVQADAIGGLITASASGVPMLRKSRLPSIITHGTGSSDAAMPSRMLAFASSEGLDEAVPMPVARPATFSRPLALRSARHRTVLPAASARDAARVAEAVVDAADSGATALPGAHVTGLRRAAHMMAEKAAL